MTVRTERKYQKRPGAALALFVNRLNMAIASKRSTVCLLPYQHRKHTWHQSNDLAE